MKKVVLFCRVSSTNDRQSFDRQINDLKQLAESSGYEIAGIFAEKVSGAKKNSERKELMKMIEFVKVLVTELSRLGRDPLQILQTLEILNDKKISLFIQNYNIETLTPEKEINPMSQLLCTLLAEIARMERTNTYSRLKSGYQNFRANSGKVGRKEGYRKNEESLRIEYAEEIKMLKKGYSYQDIVKITSTNKNTLTKLKKLILN
jgi:DNA invertase Pin-like site-specific DNA recombinase